MQKPLNFFERFFYDILKNVMILKIKKYIMKKVIKKELKFIGRRAFGALIFVAVAGTSLWALAAFSEPTTGPAASIQDFATNIMGANNDDNAFDSSAVTANTDGSILERLEALEGPSAGYADTSNRSFASAVSYCENLSASPEYYRILDDSRSIPTETYSDWRVPTLEEIKRFTSLMENAGSYSYWTSMSENSSYQVIYNFYDSGSLGSVSNSNTYSVRTFCVR